MKRVLMLVVMLFMLVPYVVAIPNTLELISVFEALESTVEVTILLDESGSMSTNRESTISAFNDFLNKQKERTSTTIYLSLLTFNGNGMKTIYESISVKNIGELKYQQYNPDSNTPLYDSVGKSILFLESNLKKREVECITCHSLHRPKALLVVMTDGLENASTEFNLLKIQELIKEKKYKGWEVLYIGDNLEQQRQAESMGFWNVKSIPCSNTSGRMDSINTTLDSMIKGK